MCEHKFDQFDMEHEGDEWAHCEKCGKWVNTKTGELDDPAIIE
jgi:hypothetical protein